MAMEPKERMLLEGVLGAVLIAFLVLASIMIVSAYSKPETTITNSYNTNSYNTNSFNTYPSQTARLAYTTAQYRMQSTSSYPPRYPSKTYVYTKPYIVDRTDYTVNRRDYAGAYYNKDSSRYLHRDTNYYSDDRYYSDSRYLKYGDSGNLRTYSGIVGNMVDSYEVYVRNREYTGGYFKTTFYFEDYYGNVDSQSMMYYIPAKDGKNFVFKDVSPPEFKYRAWRYEVVSLTKEPARTYPY